MKDRKLYVGFTRLLKNRIEQHRRGEVVSTRSRRPLTLIHYEAYRCKVDAERREKYLKGGNGRASLKIQLQTDLVELGYKYI